MFFFNSRVLICNFCHFLEYFDSLVVIGPFSSKEYADWMKTIGHLLVMSLLMFFSCLYGDAFWKTWISHHFGLVGVPYMRSRNIEAKRVSDVNLAIKCQKPNTTNYCLFTKIVCWHQSLMSEAKHIFPKKRKPELDARLAQETKELQASLKSEASFSASFTIMH